MNLLNIRPRTVVQCVCLAMLATAGSSSFAQRVLLSGPVAQVTEADVIADAATRISDTARDTMLSRPGTVQQLAANVYVQRAMALEAERHGLVQGPAAAAIVALAREKALADLYWADFERKNQPSAESLEAYAQSTYRAASHDTLKAPERSRVRHILLKEKSPANRARLEQWLKDVQAGAADFAQLARTHSEDAGSVNKGGDLGYVADGMTVAPFEAAFKEIVAPGGLSPVVETQFGYHIIRLEERRAEGPRGYDEMRDQLLLNARSALLREARAREVQRLQQGMEPNAERIESFSAQFKPVEGAR
jgi:peptidyl-prolyl cis-trans isomerase C